MSEQAWPDPDEQRRPTGPPPGPPGRPPGPAIARPQRGPLGTTLLILGVIGVVATLAASIWTEVLWFDSVGKTRVFTTQLSTQFLVGGLAGLLVAGLVWSSLHLAYRHRPIYAPVTPQQDALDRYRAALEPIRKMGTILLPVVLGLIFGLGAAQQWESFLLWRNAKPFNQTDPHFGMDIGFFVFQLPFLTFLVGFLTMAFLFAAAAAAMTHYVYGGLQLANRGRDTTRFALLHVSGLLAVVVLLRAAGYWLERYSLSVKSSELMTGVQYTDATAVLPTKAILAIASIMCALMFLSVIWTRSWRLPVIGTVLLLVLSVVVGGLFPMLIQSLRVKPSEISLEAPYLARNIAASRAAYGLDVVQTTNYTPNVKATPEQLRQTAAAIPGIRIVDPNVVSPTFKQLHAVRNYYAFPDSLDIGRYVIDGQRHDVVIAAREVDLSGVPAGARNWVNDHTVYTHGYGVVAAFANQQNAGQPVFIESSIPAGKALGEYEPRIYFGEQSPAYSIVGAPAGSAPREFDYPAQVEGQQVNNTYAGRGGVEIGSMARRLAYALKYREANFLLSDVFNDASRILDYRTPRERVSRVAPWLTLDGNAYPAIVDGRVLWVLDGYTTTDSYPNSSLSSMNAITSDSITRTRRSVSALDQGQLNYIRNSVKATVDAFDGTVRLYQWDDKDPILQAWRDVFPGIIEDRSAISGSLMQHLRYPEDLLKVQRAMLARYHVLDPAAFYGRQDFWRVPLDPTQTAQVEQPAYYLSIAMPGQQQPEFSLTTTFMPQGDRNVLTGFLAVDSNAGNTAGTPREGYGALRLLELPPSSNVDGVPQVYNRINSSNESAPGFSLTLSQFLASGRQQGNATIMGNLLTLPMAGGMLFVEPIYLQGASSSPFPLGRAVVVVFGDKLAWGATLESALNQLFQTTPGTVPPSTPAPAPTPGTPPATGNAALAQAISDAQAAFAEGEQALKDGDFAKYGEAQRKLKEALGRAAAAAPQGGSVTITPTPTSTPTPTQ